MVKAVFSRDFARQMVPGVIRTHRVVLLGRYITYRDLPPDRYFLVANSYYLKGLIASTLGIEPSNAQGTYSL